MKDWFQKNVLYFALTVALASTLGSLYFSEILRYPPCNLCWYQRILMYPLVIILIVGILKKDKHLAAYVLPFTFLGLLIAGYHHLLQVGVIPENLIPCASQISCAAKYLYLFNFITLPSLSFAAFFIISACLIIYHQQNKPSHSYTTV